MLRITSSNAWIPRNREGNKCRDCEKTDRMETIILIFRGYNDSVKRKVLNWHHGDHLQRTSRFLCGLKGMRIGGEDVRQKLGCGSGTKRDMKIDETACLQAQGAKCRDLSEHAIGIGGDNSPIQANLGYGCEL